LHTLSHHISMAIKSRAENRRFMGHKGVQGTQPPKRNAKQPGAKVWPFGEVLRLVNAAKRSKKVVVTTNGCFDILHAGHVKYLAEAKRHGDVLIVGVNTDASVRRNKGPSRPINTERDRAEVIASLKPVDAVFIFDETTPEKWLAKLQPHIHVKGADRKMHQIVEKDVVERHGGKIVLAKVVDGRSTTNIIKKVLGS